MKKLTFVLGLCFMMNAFAQTPVEAGWKSQLRGIITNIAGTEWGDKLLGKLPVAEPLFKVPVVPANLKKSTDIESYTKITKEPTEFDKLPADRKRQFDYKFIQELYLVTRKMDAKDEDLSAWLNTLDQGGSREGIYQALVLDEVYSGLENVQEKPSKELMDFTLKFSQKFLNQTFKTETLERLNLYSLKRIISEKTLDLFEYYEAKDLEALNQWYAIFSSDLAKDYSPLLKSQVRSDEDMNYHYEWAKSSPVQHIKSEVVIKLHTVMNGLQLLQK